MVVYPITTLAVGCSADFEAVESFDSTADGATAPVLGRKLRNETGICGGPFT